MLPLKIEDVPLTEGQFPHLKIIVTDDDVTMCEHMTQMLGKIGIHADWASSGVQMLEKIKEAKRGGQMYDAVLLDWIMPGQNGLETTRLIRESCGNQLPVLIISAYDWSDVEEEATEAGATGFLQKPIFVSTLIHGLQRYVPGGQPDRSKQNVNSNAIFANKSFLLVEDNVFNQEVAAELLSDMGVMVDVACDGGKGGGNALPQ